MIPGFQEPSPKQLIAERGCGNHLYRHLPGVSQRAQWVLLITFVAVVDLLSSSAWAQPVVYRCGNSYSEAPCKGGKVVDTSPVMSDPRGPMTKEIYLCKAPQGARYWTPEHCAHRGWTIERIQRVPAHVGWDDQVAAGRQQKDQAEAQNTAPAQNFLPQAIQPSQPSKTQACSALDERVVMLDSMGRAGSRYYDLDWIRRERKDARDQQYRLRC